MPEFDEFAVCDNCHEWGFCYCNWQVDRQGFLNVHTFDFICRGCYREHGIHDWRREGF